MLAIFHSRGLGITRQVAGRSPPFGKLEADRLRLASDRSAFNQVAIGAKFSNSPEPQSDYSTATAAQARERVALLRFALIGSERFHGQ